MKQRGEGFGPEAKRRIMLGTYALSSGYYDQYYTKAQKVRTLIIKDFEEAFKKFDLIIGPTSPGPALKVGASIDSPMFGELEDMLLEPSSIAGLTSISVPCGFVDGLDPVEEFHWRGGSLPHFDEFILEEFGLVKGNETCSSFQKLK